MTKPALKQLPSLWAVVFILCLCCACQANGSPAHSAAPAAIAPSPTARPSATAQAEVRVAASPEPSAAAAPEGTPTAAAAATLSPTGPWLVFMQAQFVGEGYRQVDLILFNQDGSGRAQIRVPDCGPGVQFLTESHPGNFLANLAWETYLINPLQAKALKVHDPAFPCGAYFKQSAQAGLWAVTYRDAKAVASAGPPELRIYQLPEGKLLNTFPMLRCTGAPEECSINDVAWGAQVWDPSGRSMAFPAALDGDASGLFIYNVERNQASQVARFAGSISDIEWSPDGKKLVIMLSAPHDLPIVSSVWAARPAGGEPKLVFTPEYAALQEIVAWVDSDRFLVCSGSLRRVATEGAYDLRLVKISTGGVKDLFMDSFVAAELDPKSQVVALFTTAPTIQSDSGLYLIPLTGSRPRPLARPPEVADLQIEWRADIGLFVTPSACQENSQQYWAFDAQGKWRCTELPAPTGSAPAGAWASPDGQWQAFAQEGLWVESQAKPRTQVYPGTPNAVIWQPDSGGFFFIATKNLYHVSLPELTLTDLRLKIEGDSQVAYQWIGWE